MKRLLLLSVALLLSAQVFGNVVERVEGKLTSEVVNNVLSERIETKYGVIHLSHVPEEAVGCKEGIFTIVSDRWGASDTFQILNVDSCYKRTKIKLCPEYYSPVCGSTEKEVKTFSNPCFMNASEFDFVHLGKCQEEK